MLFVHSFQEIGTYDSSTVCLMVYGYLQTMSRLKCKYLFIAFFCRDLGNAGISGPLIPDLGGLENLQYL